MTIFAERTSVKVLVGVGMGVFGGGRACNQRRVRCELKGLAPTHSAFSEEVWLPILSACLGFHCLVFLTANSQRRDGLYLRVSVCMCVYTCMSYLYSYTVQCQNKENKTLGKWKH